MTPNDSFCAPSATSTAPAVDMVPTRLVRPGHLSPSSDSTTGPDEGSPSSRTDTPPSFQTTVEADSPRNVARAVRMNADPQPARVPPTRAGPARLPGQARGRVLPGMGHPERPPLRFEELRWRLEPSARGVVRKLTRPLYRQTFRLGVWLRWLEQSIPDRSRRAEPRRARPPRMAQRFPRGTPLCPVRFSSSWFPPLP